MASLALCLERAWGRVAPEDRAMIERIAAEYRSDGVPSREAVLRAFDELLDSVREDRANLLGEIRAQGGAVPMPQPAREGLTGPVAAPTQTAEAAPAPSGGDDIVLLGQALATITNDPTVGDLYEASPLLGALQPLVATIERVFGVRVIPVRPVRDPGDMLFEGFTTGANPGVLYINTEGNVDFIAVVGHELLHHLKRTAPELYAAFIQDARQHFRNFPAFYEQLKGLQTAGEKPYTRAEAVDELAANFMGDAFLDPTYLRGLAKRDGNLFQELVHRALLWLQDLKARLTQSGYGSSDYFRDVEGLRASLSGMLQAYVEGGAQAVDGAGANFSRAVGRGDTHAMEVERQKRETGGAERVRGEKKIIDAAARKFKVRADALEKRMLLTKNLFPQSAGWAPLKLKDFREDKKGAPQPVWEAIPYTFEKAGVDKLTAGLFETYSALQERSASGDQAASVALRQIAWYRNMRARLREEFGTFGDLFADLLGATSPNTSVPINWRFAVEAMHRASRGEYDNIIDGIVAWDSRRRAQVQEQAAYKEQETAKGRLVKDVIKDQAYIDLGKKEPLPERLNPLRGVDSQGEPKRFGMNSTHVARALADLWREVTPGDAPKAKNFSGNLIGYSKHATVDVWAARLLQRLAGEPRVPPPAEIGVRGKHTARTSRDNPQVGGQYGVAMNSFGNAADRIGIDPDGLQAVAWFAEKEVWTKNGWTTAVGEGGSFEAEADRMPVDRFVGMLSVEESAENQGQSYRPTDADMAALTAEIEAAEQSTPGFLVGKASSTLGRFGNVDGRSFDIELVASRGADPAPLWNKIVEIGKARRQAAVGLSRVLQPGEEVDPLRHRPGLEIYFRDPMTLGQAEPLIAQLNAAGAQFFTFATDVRRFGPQQAGLMGKVTGLRLQWVPEFSDNPDPTMSDEAIQQAHDAAVDELVTTRDKVAEIPGIAYAEVLQYDTRVAFKGDYDGETGGPSQGVSPEGRGKAWTGLTVREGLERADRSARGVRADGLPDQQGDVPGVRDRSTSDGKFSRVPRGPEGVDRGGRAQSPGRIPRADGLTGDTLPVRSDGRVPLTHWGRVGGLQELDPAFFGTAAAGAEKGRMGPDFRKRTYYALPGYRLDGAEAPVASRTNARYFTSIDPADIYDFAGDPDGLRDKLLEAERQRPLYQRFPGLQPVVTPTDYENAILEAGYRGYWTTSPLRAVALFDKQAVAEVTDRALEDPAMAGWDSRGSSMDQGKELDIKFSRVAPSAAPTFDAPGDLTRWDKVKTSLVDTYQAMVNVQTAIGAVPEEQDVSLHLTTYPGRLRARVDEYLENDAKPLLEAVHASGRSWDEIGRFLHARHAQSANAVLKERNPDAAALATKLDALKIQAKDLVDQKALIRQTEPKRYARNDFYRKLEADHAAVKAEIEHVKAIKPRPNNTALSGMSDTEAQQILAASANDQLLQLIGQYVDRLNERRLQILVDAGVMPQAQADSWSQMWEHYIPLNREELDEALPSRGKGFDARGKLAKTRAGSTRQVDHKNVVARVLAMHEAALARAEKNEVAKALYRLAEANPNDEIWEVGTENLPQVATLRPDQTINWISNTWAAETMVAKIDGENRYLTFNRQNEHARRILQALKDTDGKKGNLAINTLLVINRALSMINTGLNPEFVISNFFRDIQTAAYNLTDTELKNMEARVIKDVPKAMGGMRAFLRKGNRQGQWAQYAEEFAKAGGMTGWMSSYESVAARLKQMQRFITSEHTPGLKQLKRTFEFIDDYNGVVENAVRLSAYVNARNVGLSQAKAARLAKELTVNFNRKGEWGLVLNGLYLFYNASIQGTARLLRATMNPKNHKLHAMLGATVAMAVMMDMLNRMFGGDDDDGESLYDKIPGYIKERNLILMDFWGLLESEAPEDRYFTIPLPWGYNWFHVLGQEIGKAASHYGMDEVPDYSPFDSGARLLGSAMQAFNPISSGTVLQTVAPTVADPLAMIAENKDWTGRPLMPDYNPSQPNFEKFYSTARSQSQWLAAALHEATINPQTLKAWADVSPEWIDVLYDFTTGGAGRFLADAGSLVTKGIKGEDVEIKEVPLLRKVVGSVSDSYRASIYYDRLYEILDMDTRLNKAKGTPQWGELRRGVGDRIKLVPLAKAAKKQVSALKKQIKAAEAEGDPLKAERFRERMAEVQMRFSRQYLDVLYPTRGSGN